MRKLVTLSLVLFLSITAAFAQSKNRQDIEARQQKQFEKLVQDLNLNDKQQKEWKAVNEKYAKQMQADREQMKQDKANAREKMQKLSTDRESELSKILNSDQKTKWEEKKATAKAKREARDGKRGGKNRGERK